MEIVCLSCLNKVTHEDKLYKLGSEIYHEFCYIDKVMNKAIKYANQIKSLEPEQIVSQLYGTEKFTLTDEEKAIIKLQQSSPKLNSFADYFYNFSKQIGFNNVNYSQLDLKNIFVNLGTKQLEDIINTQFDSIYEIIMTKSNFPNIQNIMTKEDLKLLLNSATSNVLTDYNFVESLFNSQTTNTNNLLVDKLFENLPQDLKTKLSNINTQSQLFSTQQIFTNVNTESNVDTESNSNSDTELNSDNDFDTEELVNQITELKKNFNI
jgi:hypothetical protein